MTARLATPAGWTSGSHRVALKSREFGPAELPVKAVTDAPDVFPLRATGSSPDGEALTGTAAEVQVQVALPGQLCQLALDAGTAGSPVQAGYHRLLATDAWDADRGYGWVGGAPMSRDRGVLYDDLSRDFLNDLQPRTTRRCASTRTTTRSPRWSCWSSRSTRPTGSP